MIGPSDFGRTLIIFLELLTRYSGNAAKPTPAGVGLAALPEYLVSNSRNIIKVLPKSEGPITEAHFVYPQSLKNTARVTAFRNFLFSKIGDWKSQ